LTLPGKNRDQRAASKQSGLANNSKEEKEAFAEVVEEE